MFNVFLYQSKILPTKGEIKVAFASAAAAAKILINQDDDEKENTLD